MAYNYEDSMKATQQLKLQLLEPESLMNKVRRIQCRVVGHVPQLLDKIQVTYCHRCHEQMED